MPGLGADRLGYGQGGVLTRPPQSPAQQPRITSPTVTATSPSSSAGRRTGAGAPRSPPVGPSSPCAPPRSRRWSGTPPDPGREFARPPERGSQRVEVLLGLRPAGQLFDRDLHRPGGIAVPAGVAVIGPGRLGHRGPLPQRRIDLAHRLVCADHDRDRGRVGPGRLGGPGGRGGGRSAGASRSEQPNQRQQHRSPSTHRARVPAHPRRSWSGRRLPPGRQKDGHQLHVLGHGE